MADTCSSCTTPQRTGGWPAREHGSAHTPRVAYTLEAAEDTLAQQRSREGPQLLITPPSSGGFKSWGFRCPGSKKFSKRGDPTCVGGSPHPKILFCLFFSRGYYWPSASTSDQRRLEKGTSGGVRRGVRSENPGHQGARDFHKGVRSDLPWGQIQPGNSSKCEN